MTIVCYLTINCDTGQHSQFLRCFLMTSLSDYHVFILYFNNIDVRMFQVYFQLDSQREVVRTLRRLLKEKFADSTQDCPRDAFVENQEVIVKWKDDEWARAR